MNPPKCGATPYPAAPCSLRPYPGGAFPLPFFWSHPAVSYALGASDREFLSLSAPAVGVEARLPFAPVVLAPRQAHPFCHLGGEALQRLQAAILCPRPF